MAGWIDERILDDSQFGEDSCSLKRVLDSEGESSTNAVGPVSSS